MYPTPTNVTGVLSLFQYTNTVIGNDGLGLGILMALFVISFFSLLRWGSDRAFAVSSVTAFAVSLFLRFAGLLNDKYVYATFLLMCIGAVWIYIRSTRE
jgi:hypothetical protein